MTLSPFGGSISSKVAKMDKSVLMTVESNKRCHDMQTVSKYSGTNQSLSQHDGK